MEKLEKYLHDTLGADVAIQPFPVKKLGGLPLYLRNLYHFQEIRLFERNLILLSQNETEYLSADQYHKQIRQIEQALDRPVVLVLEAIEAYNRKRLIEKQIAFIIPDKQMFLPHLLIDLREFGFAAKKRGEKIQPAAQCLLLYHLLKENVVAMNFKMIARKLSYSQMTITRAVDDLVERKICSIKGRKDKQIIFDADKKTVWEKALPFLQNPIQKKFYIDENLDSEFIFKAGYLALSYYTNISGDSVDCFAISKTDYAHLKKQKRISISNKKEGRYCIEIWKYAPGILSETGIVDPLSLYLTFMKNQDERIDMEIEKMVAELW